MKLSIIVPLYNEEKTIGLCLNALISETSKNDEIIVIDNGSTDNSLNIVKESFNKIKLVQKPIGTISEVRNEGAKIATGDLLAFIDADCIICPGWKAHVINTFKTYQIDATGSKYISPKNACWIEKAWFSQKKDMTNKAKYINSGNLIIQKKIFDKFGGFNEKLITGEDTELCYRINKSGGVILENPNISAVHLGNPKSIFQFYKKQRWHGLGMMGTLKIDILDKPFFMTILFFILFLASIANLFNFKSESIFYSLFISVALFAFVPALTAIYRVIQYQNYHYYFQLSFLYIIYFIARIESLFIILLEEIKKI